MKVSERAPKEMFWVEWTTAQRETRDSLSAKSPASTFLSRCSKRRRRANRDAPGNAVGRNEKTTQSQQPLTRFQPKKYPCSALTDSVYTRAEYCSRIVIFM